MSPSIHLFIEHTFLCSSTFVSWSCSRKSSFSFTGLIWSRTIWIDFSEIVDLFRSLNCWEPKNNDGIYFNMTKNCFNSRKKQNKTDRMCPLIVTIEFIQYRTDIFSCLFNSCMNNITGSIGKFLNTL